MSSIFRLYTQYFPSKPTLTEENLHNQVGKVSIVTGGNIVIVFELVKILYCKGAKSILSRTTEEKAQQAIKIMATRPTATSGGVKYLHLDLAGLTTIKGSVEGFAAQEAKLDVLRNKAGVVSEIPKPLSSQADVPLIETLPGFLFD
jgi:NAD(P)-dependent dehydrogenase (short-subunit alcohol dehydrogenase family)